MAETADNTYATTSLNAAAATPNKVAVVNDGTGDRQIVGIGALDGTTNTAAVTSASHLLVSEAADAGSTGFSFNYQSALTNTKVAVKASAGLLAGWHIYNPNTVVIYIQVFNKASAGVTLGSTAPDFVIVVPAAGWEDFSPLMPGIAMGTAITLAATTTASGSTAPTSSLVGTFFYI